MKNLRIKLVLMEVLVSFPRDQAPSASDVKKLSGLATELVRDIAKKDQK